MAFTRIGQTGGGESGSILELPVEYAAEGTVAMTITTTNPKTSARAFAMTTTTRGRGWTFASKLSLSAAMFFRHSSIGSGAAIGGSLFRLAVTGVSDAYIYVKGSTATIDMVVNGVVVATVGWASVGFSTVDVWYHLGMTYYADATSGYFTLYLDGVNILTWTGNTGTGVTGCYFGGIRSATASSGWTSSAAMDDIYLDGSSILETDIVPSTRYFVWSVANTAGNYAQFTPSAGTNVSCVDEVPGNSDTDYVVASVAAKIDSYNTANPTIGAGLSPIANIAVVFARKTDGAIGSTLQLGFRESATDVFGTDQALTTNYAILMERALTKPSGGNWDVTAVNAAEVAIKSTGTY